MYEEEFIGKRIKNRYLILEKLGQGGMGVVFKASLKVVEREVALKIFMPQPGMFTPSQEQELRTRFIAEAHAIAKMRHNNIMALHDFDIDNEICFNITDQYLEDIKLHGVSYEICKKLEKIGNYLFIGKNKFLNILESTIGKETNAKYCSIILKYAAIDIPFYTMDLLSNNLAKLIREDLDYYNTTPLPE